jgi:hypothetical protein
LATAIAERRSSEFAKSDPAMKNMSGMAVAAVIHHFVEA